jgi:N-acyl homoserine lactone hydrolase
MSDIAIRPLTTGHVQIHEAMHRGVGTGLRRRARIMRKGPMGPPLPIHAWLIEHPEGVLLVDAGETHTARSATFAHFHVTREDELDRQLQAAGLAPGDIAQIVLTHIHGDHVDGLPHVPHARVFASADEVAIARSLQAKATRTLVRQPLPAGFAPVPFAWDGAPVGAFATSHAFTGDARVLAVPAPGHTLGHVAILVRQGDHDVLIGGDSAYDLQQLLDLHVDGVSPKDDVAQATMRTILEHSRQTPTVYLPSHDPRSAERLRATETVGAAESQTA